MYCSSNRPKDRIFQAQGIGWQEMWGVAARVVEGSWFVDEARNSAFALGCATWPVGRQTEEQ